MEQLSPPALRVRTRSDIVHGARSRLHRRRALRVRRGTAETVVRVFEAPGGGRLLHLVGTVHLGDAAYFEALSAVLADLADAGAAVHYERIRRADDADVTDEERDQLERVEATGYPQGLEAFVGVLGLALQGECLVLPPGARNVDVSDVELLRSLGGDRYRRLLARTDITIDERAAPLAHAMFGVLLKHGRALDRIRAVSRRQRRVNRFLIGERNRLALQEGLKALRDHDVALVWGTAHLPGMARELRRQGYRLRAERWLPACTL